MPALLPWLLSCLLVPGMATVSTLGLPPWPLVLDTSVLVCSANISFLPPSDLLSVDLECEHGCGPEDRPIVSMISIDYL